MGNSHSRQIYTNFSESLELSKFTLIEQFFVEPLGEIHELSTNNSNEKLFLKIINIDKEIHVKEINSIHEKLDLKHPTLLKLLGYNFSHKFSKGSIQTEVMFYFEPPAKTLQDEIIERRNNQEIFSAMELLHYFKTCIDGLAFLEENGCSYEFITSETIFFSFENQIRIINPAIVDLINYSESLKSQKEKSEKENLSSCELSQIMSLTEKSIQNSVITLGITFLACALLEDEEMIYHLYEIHDYERFEALNERLRSRCPIDFINILRNMLVQDESQRPNFIQLRDNLDKYTKSNGKDDQFPISPLEFPENNLNHVFPDTAPSKIYSNSIILNSYVSPRNPFASSKLTQEHLLKEPKKSFLDKLFCGLCSSNADEKTELALSARPYRRTEGSRQMKIEENPDEIARLHDHVLEEFSREASEQTNRAKLSNLLPKKSQGQNLPSKQSNIIQGDDRVQRNENQMFEIEKKNYHLSSKPGASVRYKENNEAIKEDQYESSQNISNSYKNYFSPLKEIHPNENSKLGNSPFTVSPEKKSQRKVIIFGEVENENSRQDDSKIKDSYYSAFSQKNSNIKKSTYSTTSNIHNLTSKKKSALVKKIIAQYKKSAEAKNQSQMFGQHFDKSFRTVVSKFESHEKPYPSTNRILITDYLAKTQEKVKKGAISSSRFTGVMDSQNFQSYRSMYGDEKKTFRNASNPPNENIGGNQNSISEIIKPKFHGQSQYSTPYRGSMKSQKSSMLVMNNECPNCQTPFMSINKSYQYSVAGDFVNQEERDEKGVFSQRESPNLFSDQRLNYDLKATFSPNDYQIQEEKNETNYRLKVTPVVQ